MGVVCGGMISVLGAQVVMWGSVFIIVKATDPDTGLALFLSAVIGAFIAIALCIPLALYVTPVVCS